MISFIVPGEPVLFVGSGSKDEFRVPPPCKRAYQAEISIIASNAMGGEPPLAGPIEVTIRAEYVIQNRGQKRKKKWQFGKRQRGMRLKS